IGLRLESLPQTQEDPDLFHHEAAARFAAAKTIVKQQEQSELWARLTMFEGVSYGQMRDKRHEYCARAEQLLRAAEQAFTPTTNPELASLIAQNLAKVLIMQPEEQAAPMIEEALGLLDVSARFGSIRSTEETIMLRYLRGEAYAARINGTRI